jgi:dihydrodipicolinate synthase/N-acetylneuraminate lyase
MAKGARDAGVDAIACVPPFFYHPSDQTIIDYYNAVADASSLPLFVYNQPRYTGVEFTPAMMEKMVRAIPQLAGVKHSAPDFNNIRRFADMGLAVLTGHGSLFLPALVAGGVGVIDGPLTVAPEVWVGIYRAYLEGDLARAQKLQGKANKLIDLAARFGMQATCKVLASERWGVDCGVPRLPIPALSRGQRKELIDAAEALGVLKTPQPAI